MLNKMNQTEKTQTYKVKCPHENCGYENIFYHLDWEYTSMICQKCKREIGEKEVLEQLQLDKTEKTQTYKITCPHCKTVKRVYRKEFTNIVCLECKKEFGEKAVLKQLAKYD